LWFAAFAEGLVLLEELAPPQAARARAEMRVRARAKVRARDVVTEDFLIGMAGNVVGLGGGVGLCLQGLGLWAWGRGLGGA
jgi:hypothetical protein